LAAADHVTARRGAHVLLLLLLLGLELVVMVLLLVVLVMVRAVGAVVSATGEVCVFTTGELNR
jgi:hypothetical protein